MDRAEKGKERGRDNTRCSENVASGRCGCVQRVSDMWKAGDTGNAPLCHMVIITGLFGRLQGECAACRPVSCSWQLQLTAHTDAVSTALLQSRRRGLRGCEPSCLWGDRGLFQVRVALLFF